MAVRVTAWEAFRLVPTTGLKLEVVVGGVVSAGGGGAWTLKFATFVTSRFPAASREYQEIVREAVPDAGAGTTTVCLA